MKDRSVSLSAQQRSALILCDGKRSQEDVVRMTAAVGVTMQDLLTLAELGLIDMGSAPSLVVSAVLPQAMRPAMALESNSPAVQAAATASSAIDFNAALSAAVMLCSNLGFKGFGLNMALTGVDNLEKLQKLAPEIRRAAGEAKYQPLHALIFGEPL